MAKINEHDRSHAEPKGANGQRYDDSTQDAAPCQSVDTRNRT
jgi:hypothetical protein